MRLNRDVRNRPAPDRPVRRRRGKSTASLQVTGLAMMLILAVGCSASPSERQVFEDSRESSAGPVQTDELVDMVVQFTNLTGESVHLVGLSLVGALPNVRLVGTSVYDISRVGGFPAEDLGNLPIECPREFAPSPVSSLVVGPHQYSGWFGVLTIRILKPGRYTISRIKISYSTSGGPGWQYFSSNLTLTVRNPPLPGPRPISSQEACI